MIIGTVIVSCLYQLQVFWPWPSSIQFGWWRHASVWPIRRMFLTTCGTGDWGRDLLTCIAMRAWEDYIRYVSLTGCHSSWRIVSIMYGLALYWSAYIEHNWLWFCIQLGSNLSFKSCAFVGEIQKQNDVGKNLGSMTGSCRQKESWHSEMCSFSYIYTHTCPGVHTRSNRHVSWCRAVYGLRRVKESLLQFLPDSNHYSVGKTVPVPPSLLPSSWFHFSPSLIPSICCSLNSSLLPSVPLSPSLPHSLLSSSVLTHCKGHLNTSPWQL